MRPVVLLIVVGAGAALAAPALSGCANDPAASRIPDAVLQAYEAAPAALRKALFRCRSRDVEVFRVTWSTGYETGSRFFSAQGRFLGVNRKNDVGMAMREYDDEQLSGCTILRASPAGVE